jgi:uncharacterized protein YecE (DUF72 family)
MENSEEKEVKEFNEVKVMQPSADKADDEIIEPVVKETETPAPSSEEDKPAPEPEPEPTPEKDTEKTDQEPVPEAEVAPEVVKEPKPVEGETPREKALRLEATRLKGLLRKERQDELFVKQPTVKSKEEDLSEYDPEELKRFEKLAKSLGFAKRDEIVRDSVQDKNNNEFETFIEAHPEYSAENDKDGVLWNQFKTEFALYNPPQDPKTLRKVLNKVHNEIYGVKPAVNLNKINAQQQKLKVASHAGTMGSKASISSPKTIINSNIRRDMLKGFSEEDLVEMGL